jgi:hypothetical protein
MQGEKAMTVKVSKKDKLSALMTMWNVLKTENQHPAEGDFALLRAVEAQLKDVLDLKPDSESNPEGYNIDASKLREKLSQFRNVVYDGLKSVEGFRNQNKLDEAVARAMSLLQAVEQFDLSV